MEQFSPRTEQRLNDLQDDRMNYLQKAQEAQKAWQQIYDTASTNRRDKNQKEYENRLEQVKEEIRLLKVDEEKRFDLIAYDVWQNLELYYKRAPKIETRPCYLSDCDGDCRSPHYTTTLKEGNYSYVIDDTRSCPVFSLNTSSLAFREHSLNIPIYTFFEHGNFKLVCNRIYDQKKIDYSLTMKRIR